MEAIIAVLVLLVLAILLIVANIKILTRASGTSLSLFVAQLIHSSFQFFSHHLSPRSSSSNSRSSYLGISQGNQSQDSHNI